MGTKLARIRREMRRPPFPGADSSRIQKAPLPSIFCEETGARRPGAAPVDRLRTGPARRPVTRPPGPLVGDWIFTIATQSVILYTQSNHSDKFLLHRKGPPDGHQCRKTDTLPTPAGKPEREPIGTSTPIAKRILKHSPGRVTETK
ncbi:hypothetical protein GCM10011608_58370 [Micromonospora sonchi]|uniref:Uncharacterized protein n=1 Tax=Micromonospora sonchi TaxID=1763543 RepID=A0A917X4N4_9ACTN|nr:hypothetical protein GCM10011608_58370 [Micromonospora sonchi]